MHAIAEDRGLPHIGTAVIRAAIRAIEPEIVAVRHDLHAHPELSNREFRTAGVVLRELDGLGLQIQSGVAHTGVVALLEGALPGPVIALRADMDALPITEATGLPYASTQRASYNGVEVGVMHACGHDAHTAILIGVARVLSAQRARLAGSVKFLFQPAEEGAPQGEEDGAKLMVEQGALDNPRPEAVFGLHVAPRRLGSIVVKKGHAMAGGTTFVARIKGRQTHGSSPWAGIDPVVAAAQVILAWQTIPSRQSNLRALPAPVVSVGRVQADGCTNIIPAEVVLEGTVRIFTEKQRRDVVGRLVHTAQKVAEASGATAEVDTRDVYPPLRNDPAVTERILPSLQAVTALPVELSEATAYGNEDFAYFSNVVPGVFISLGVTPPHIDPATAGTLHTPTFLVADEALAIGIELLSTIALDYFSEGAYSRQGRKGA